MGRPAGSLDKKRRKTKTQWTTSEVELLKQNLCDLTIVELAILLHKSKSSIRNKLKQLRLIKPNILKTCTLDKSIEWSFAGVYGLLNIKTNCIYIGSSANIANRIQNHLSRLRVDSHCTKKLQSNWNKSDFVVALLFVCDKYKTELYEQRFTRSWPEDKLYNSPPIQHTKLRLLPLERQKILDLIDKKGDDECWNWKGPLDSNGKYGRIRFDNKQYTPHRLAVFLDGRDPFGYAVCHLCNNPLCCNPKHLQLGTAIINNGHKPHPLDIYKDEMIKLYNSGMTYNSLGKKYNRDGVSIKRYLQQHVTLRPAQRKRTYVAFGEYKSLSEWVLDNRCIITLFRLKQRVKTTNLNNNNIEKIITTPFIRKTPFSTKTFEAFGEQKTVREWLLDKRCVASESTLKVRLFTIGYDVEKALTIPSKPVFKISQLEYPKIIEAAAKGETYKTIAERYNVSITTIRLICVYRYSSDVYTLP